MNAPCLSTKHQVVIPLEVRKAMGLVAGTRIWIQSVDADHALITKEPADHLKAMRGLGKDVWKRLGGGTAYLKSERKVWDK